MNFESLPILLSFYTIAILVFAVVKLEVAVALQFSYAFLVPFQYYTLFGTEIPLNAINLFLLLTFLIRYYDQIDFTITKPFVILQASLLVIGIFASETSFANQFRFWQFTTIQVLVLPFIIWNLFVINKKSINIIINTAIVSCLISGAYAIYLTQLNGLNPYTSWLAAFFNQRDAAEAFSAYESRVNFSTAGKINSTMGHPMNWSFALCFFLLIFTALQVYKKRWLYIPLISLLAFNIVTSGVRTALATIIVAWVYIVLRNRTPKLIISSALGLVAAGAIVASSPDFQELLVSIVDTSGQNSNVSGSSIPMRLEQLEGTLVEIEESPLFGKGYGWTQYYMEEKGGHPILLAFESLIFIILCNSGIIGVFVWVYFGANLLITNQKIFTNNKASTTIANSSILMFFVYTGMTGEYGYLQLFAIMHSIILSILSSITNENESVIAPYKS